MLGARDNVGNITIGVATPELCRTSRNSSELRHTQLMSVRVKVDVTEAVKGLHELEKQHLPFALAATLTNLAKGGQGKVKSGLGEKFRLRNNFTKQGIRFKPAEKKSARIEADVHTFLENRQTGAPDYGDRQEEGEDRTAYRGVQFEGARYLAVPSDYLRQLVGNKPIPAELRPAALLTAINGSYTTSVKRKGWQNRQLAIRKQAIINGWRFFVWKSKTGSPFIVGVPPGNRDTLLPFYILTRHVHTKPRLAMDETVEKYVSENFEAAWQEQWEKMHAAGLRFR